MTRIINQRQSSPGHLFICSIVFSITIQRTIASVFLNDLQPIIDFSDSCTDAYQVTISGCDKNDFSGIGGSGSCSSTCLSQLIAVTTTIQRACSGQQADPNSLIGHFFVGNAAQFLCGNSNSNSGTSGSNTESSSTILSTTMSTKGSSSTNTRASSTRSSTITSTATSLVATDTSSAPSVARTSSSTSSGSSSTGTSSTSSTGTAAQQNLSGGGSPFDIAVGSQATRPFQAQILPMILSIILALISLLS